MSGFIRAGNIGSDAAKRASRNAEIASLFQYGFT